MKYKHGFTVIEFLIIAAAASLTAILFFVQKSDLDAFSRDETRKTAINTMYYSLEEDFYAANGYYPSIINPDILPTVGEDLWTDPSGYTLGDPLSSYSYEPANCDYDNHCKEYTLKSTLEKEDTYIRNNRN